MFNGSILGFTKEMFLLVECFAYGSNVTGNVAGGEKRFV
jgi:hypothetical protein